MDELMVKVFKGEATDFEVRQLDRWRRSSPEHEAEFQELRRLWARTSELGDAPTLPPPPPLSALLESGEAMRRWESGRARLRNLIRSPFLGVPLAATAVIVMLFLTGWPGERPGGESTALSAVETFIGSGDVTTLKLSDGSVVRLASGSRIEFPPSSDGRSAVVEGKAFFAVASREDPFVIQTDLGAVRVRGTRFEVDVDRARLRVIVLEGLVDVEGRGGTLRVGAGQISYLSSDGVPVAEEGRDLRTLLDWPGGLLVFQETPFRDVAREVGDHFGVEFDLPEGEVSDRRVTAWFGDEPLEEVVSGLCMVVGARCRMERGRVVVR
jgi:transmembrane sensor